MPSSWVYALTGGDRGGVATHCVNTGDAVLNKNLEKDSTGDNTSNQHEMSLCCLTSGKRSDLKA